MIKSNLKSYVQHLCKKYNWYGLGQGSHTEDKSYICTQSSDTSFSDEKELSFSSVEESLNIGNIKQREKNEVIKLKTNFETPGKKQFETEESKNIQFKSNTKSKKLIAERNNFTLYFYQKFNDLAFNRQLPSDMSITWSKRLTSTAGLTKMSYDSEIGERVSNKIYLQ